MSSNLPVLALVGRPNVGKSTLFNRLTGARRALVAPVPGVTRDRREELVRIAGACFRLVDTGGMSFSHEVDFSREIADQVAQAVARADLVWLVVDAVDGLNPYDAELYRLLQRQGKRVLVVVNKAESPARRAALTEFFALGSEAVYPLSALHGTGLLEALEASVVLVPALRTGPEPDEAAPSARIRVAFVGRPNVGKSSLVNRILGEQRQIVSDIAGTTREAVEIPFRAFDQDYLLVDTAGIRRKARTQEGLEKLSVVNALTTLERVDVAVLVVDAQGGVADQDARIAGHILERRRAVVVALNKWDLVQAGEPKPKEVEDDIAYALRFIGYAARVRVSAVAGLGLERLFKEIRTAHREFTREVRTADLNRVVALAVRQSPPPARGKSGTKVFYGVQTATRPPSFQFFTNHAEQIQEAYTRYFENQLRYHFGFKGTPLRVEWRGRAGGEERAEQHPRPQPRAQARPRVPAGAKPPPGRSQGAKPPHGRPASAHPRRGAKPSKPGRGKAPRGARG